MKKTLSFILLAAMGVSQAQVLVNENFELLTVGNLGTDVTGATAGQNGWFTLYGTNSDYQVANIDATHGKSLTIASYNSYSATAATNNRLAARLTNVTATATNNIIRGTFDFYTGSSTGTGNVSFRILGMNGATATTIGGYNYNVSTKELTGLGIVTNLTVNPPAPALYTWSFAAAPGIQLTANTWYTLNFTYNKTTGNYTWSYPGGSGSLSSTSTSYSLIPGMVAEDLYVYNNSATGNTVSKTAGFDNILVEFTNTTALGTTEATSKEQEVTIYPNPVSDILNINSGGKLKSAVVYDMSGRKMSVKMLDKSMDVSNLQSGTYIINIETEKGKISETFIKK